MKVRTEFETKHFINYLNHFPNLTVNKANYKDGLWHIALNDGTTYSMTQDTWERVQKNVDDLKAIYDMVH